MGKKRKEKDTGSGAAAADKHAASASNHVSDDLAHDGGVDCFDRSIRPQSIDAINTPSTPPPRSPPSPQKKQQQQDETASSAAAAAAIPSSHIPKPPAAAAARGSAPRAPELPPTLQALKEHQWGETGAGFKSGKFSKSESALVVRTVQAYAEANGISVEVRGWLNWMDEGAGGLKWRVNETMAVLSLSDGSQRSQP